MSVRDGYGRHAAFREAVTLWLRLAGCDAAFAKERKNRRLPSEGVLDDTPSAPDIGGVPGVHLDTRIVESTRWGSALDAAVSGAALAENGDRAAVVLYRRAHPVSEAIVAMRLDDFAHLVTEQTEAAL